MDRVVVYLLDHRKKYTRMAIRSMSMLRQYNKDIKIICITTNPQLKLAKTLNVEILQFPDLNPNYFITNKVHLAQIDYPEILFLDSDTFFFCDVNQIFDLYTADFAACQTLWTVDLGFTDFVTFNSGAILFRNKTNKTIYTNMEHQINNLSTLHPDIYTFLTEKYSLWTQEELLLSKLVHQQGIPYQLFARNHVRIMDEEKDLRFMKDSLIFHSYTNMYDKALAQLEHPKVKLFKFKGSSTS
jgi:hypothetical protein